MINSVVAYSGLVDEEIQRLEQIKSMPFKTPFFVFTPSLLERRYRLFKQLFPEGTEIFYAMKSNSESLVLDKLREMGSGFEVASHYELPILKELNVRADKIISGNSVKSSEHIKAFADFGVTRFAFDSYEELERLAINAPGAKVFLRVLVKDEANSVFTMSKKFGAPMEDGLNLMLHAKKLGLKPFGLSFNVGSQARNKDGWANGIRYLRPLIESLRQAGMTIEMLNLGGGFPWRYLPSDDIPDLKVITDSIKNAVAQLPHQVRLFIEPGRSMSAQPYDLVVGVNAKIMRASGHWLYLDAGAYTLLESMPYQGSTNYAITTVSNYSCPNTEFILTGPTCDDLDVLAKNADLPRDIKEGDRLIIHAVGAYTFTLATKFNGFPTPPVHVIAP